MPKANKVDYDKIFPHAQPIAFNKLVDAHQAEERRRHKIESKRKDLVTNIAFCTALCTGVIVCVTLLTLLIVSHAPLLLWIFTMCFLIIPIAMVILGVMIIVSTVPT